MTLGEKWVVGCLLAAVLVGGFQIAALKREASETRLLVDGNLLNVGAFMGRTLLNWKNISEMEPLLAAHGIRNIPEFPE